VHERVGPAYPVHGSAAEHVPAPPIFDGGAWSDLEADRAEIGELARCLQPIDRPLVRDPDAQARGGKR